MRFRILVQKDGDGVHIANVPSLPGCVSDGKARKEALKNIKDAITGYLASLKKHNELPSFEIQEIVPLEKAFTASYVKKLKSAMKEVKRGKIITYGLEHDEALSAEEKRDIKKSLKEIKKGRVDSLPKVRKELGI